MSTTARTPTTTQIRADKFEDLNPSHVNNFDDDDGKLQSKLHKHDTIKPFLCYHQQCYHSVHEIKLNKFQKIMVIIRSVYKVHKVEQKQR